MYDNKPKKRYNLNEQPILINNLGMVGKQIDYKTTSSGITCHFQNIDKYIAKYICQSDAVFGCVCWLTSQTIMNAMISVNTLMIVSKDAQIRPEICNSGRPRDLAKLTLENYSKFSFDFDNFILPDEVKSIEKYKDQIQPVRCCGAYATDTQDETLMHNKYIVLCKAQRTKEPTADTEQKKSHKRKEHIKKILIPYAIVTGSYNYCPAANNSFENAIFIRNEPIARAYLSNFFNIFMLSEKIPWTNPCPITDLKILSSDNKPVPVSPAKPTLDVNDELALLGQDESEN